jgi:hypothetical protein
MPNPLNPASATAMTLSRSTWGNKSTPEQIEEAAAFIRQSAARQMESLQTIMDSATLAAEQVQDKRLEVLEQGPEVTALDIFWDFALTFILESPLPGKLLRGITQKWLLPRVRSNLGAKEYALRTIALRGSKLRALGRLSDVEGLSAARLAKEIPILQQVTKILDGIGSEGGADAYLVALAKAAREVSPKERKSAPLHLPSDTPGVAILDLAQAQASTQRLSIQIEHSMFELWVRTGQIPIETVYQVLKWEPTEVDGRLISLAEIKDVNKLYFELLIWTLLLYDRPFTGKPVTAPRQSFTLKGYVQPSLIDYWLQRFLDPQTGKPFADTPALKRPGGKPNLDMSIGALGNYMWKIAEAAARNKVALVSDGPLVPKKDMLPTPQGG